MAAGPDLANEDESRAAVRPRVRLRPAGAEDKRSYRRDASRAFWFALGNTPIGNLVLPHKLKRALKTTEARSGTFALPYPLARWSYGDGLVTDVDPGRLSTWLLSFAARDGNLVVLRDFFLGSGDWSPMLRDMETSPLHQEIVELVANDLDCEKCPIYRRLVEQVASEGPIVRNYIRLGSREDVHAYFQHYADLIVSIRADGLRRSAERERQPEAGTVGGLRSRYHEMIETDVGVAVDRDGRLHRFRGGFHRTAIAKCLELERMPVAVKLVHADWLRGVIAETGLPPHEAVIAGIRSL